MEEQAANEEAVQLMARTLLVPTVFALSPDCNYDSKWVMKILGKMNLSVF